MVKLDLNGTKSPGRRSALVDDNVEAVKTLTKFCLTFNPQEVKGDTVADALGRNAMPNLKQPNWLIVVYRMTVLSPGVRFGAEHWFAKSQP
jgi:hypothetical protein